MWLDALRATLLLWGCELVLVRVTSMPAPWPDVWRSLLVLALLGLGPPLLLSLGRLGGRSPVAGLAGHAPLTLVAGAIVLPALGGGPGIAIAAVAIGALLLGGVIRGLQGSPIPGARVVLPVLALATGTAWAVEHPPRPEAIAGIASLWGALAIASLRPLTLPLLVAIAVLVARWPASPPPIHWTAAGEANGPDLVVVSVDTLRADVARTMESHRRLARRGFEFPNVLTSSPWTLPSMATAMTGVEPSRHGATRRGVGAFGAIRSDVPTLAERLAERGYDTAAVISTNPFTGARFGFDRGFAVFDAAIDLGEGALPRSTFEPTAARPVVVQLLYKLGLDQLHPVGSAEQLVERALSILERRRDRPLLLWIHFLDPHIPYRHAHETGLPRWRALERAVRSEVIGDPSWAREPGREIFWRAYRNEVEHVDRAILALLSRLESDGRETVVAVFSDHGEEFFERGGFEHGHSFHREVAEVALVLGWLGGSGPPADAGTSVETPVGHLDVLPTLLAAVGVPDPSLPGRDLTRHLDVAGVRTSVNPLYGSPEAGAAREGRWKAIFGPGGRVQLYDRENDPDERIDLAARHGPLSERLRAALTARAASPPAEGGEPGAAELSERDRAALRALGYLAD